MRILLSFFLIFILVFSSCRNRQNVDLIVHNGKVYTVDSGFSIAEAFAVKDGKIVAVGKTYDILYKYKGAELIDARGNAIYPGFIDAHAHFVGYGRSLFEVNLFGCNNWDEVLARVKKFAGEHPNDIWIRGRGWDQNNFPLQAYPDNTQLDVLFPGKAVLLDRVDGHAAIANTKALELGHVVAGQAVSGGSIETKNGKLTGLLIDNAVDILSSLIPRPSAADYEKWLTTAEKNCFQQGLTTITDCGLMYYEVAAIDSLQQRGKLQMRIYAMLTDSPANFERYIGKATYKTDRLYVRGVKAYADGALGSRGACLLAPYSDKAGWQGFLLNPVSHYDSLAKMLSITDFQMCTHAIGDSGNRIILSVYAKYLNGKNDKRWRIEHAQFVNAADYNLFGKNAVIPSVQPTHATSDMHWAGERLGTARLKYAYAYRSLLEQNGWLPLGTDFPVEDISTVKTFYAAVVRKDGKGYPQGGFQKENALTREQALRGMTIWAAKAGFMEKETGSLEPGKKADFVILNADIMQIPEDAIIQTQVFGTFIGGKKVYGN
ncbi:MAG: amidohydrolase [Taibaiella sp.]|nr:amidohydrolase [Taibaiella sp.]